MTAEPGIVVHEVAGSERESRGMSRLWLSVYWTSAGLASLTLLLSALYLALGEIELPNVITIALASLSLYIGAAFATRLYRMGASVSWFSRGTVTTRSLAVGWLLVWIAIVPGGITAALLDIEAEQITDSMGGLLQAIGAVALLGVLGPGYGEYREARDETLGYAPPHLRAPR